MSSGPNKMKKEKCGAYKAMENGVWSEPIKIGNTMPNYIFYDVRWSYYYQVTPEHVDIVWRENDGTYCKLYYGDLKSYSFRLVASGSHNAFGPVTIERLSSGRIVIVYQRFGKLYSMYSDDNSQSLIRPLFYRGLSERRKQPIIDFRR